MIAGMKSACAVNDGSLMAFSGLVAIKKALDGVEELKPEAGLFLELLACEGGCVNGPKAHCRGATVAKRQRVLRSARPPAAVLPRPPTIATPADFRRGAPPGRAVPGRANPRGAAHGRQTFGGRRTELRRLRLRFLPRLRHRAHQPEGRALHVRDLHAPARAQESQRPHPKNALGRGDRQRSHPDHRVQRRVRGAVRAGEDRPPAAAARPASKASRWPRSCPSPACSTAS